MPQYYRLANPGVASIADGDVEARVNEDGLLVVDMMTPGLKKLIAHHGGKEVQPGTLSPAQEAERAALANEFEQLMGRKPDGRRSLKQLREDVAGLRTKKPGGSGGIAKAASNANEGGNGSPPP